MSVQGDAALLEARNISKSFGGVQAVDDVSISVAKGMIHAVIGPNGAGKTTFFNSLSGFYFPDRGTVRFRGEDVTRMPNFERIRRGMSRTFQTPSIFPALSVYDNLRIGVAAKAGVSFHFTPTRGARAAAIEGKIEELLGFVNLTRFKDRPVGELSHGGQRLCEIAMSLSTDPELVLLDEPTAGLAEAETARIIGVIRDLRERLGLTVLFVEHNMRVVLSLAHRITVLDRGKMLAEGTPAQIAANDAVKEAYLGKEVLEHV
jgi:branched-chain amino acid transport system ATP-binding protein